MTAAVFAIPGDIDLPTGHAPLLGEHNDYVLKDILGLGVYLSTAVKCSKTGYGIAAATFPGPSRTRRSCRSPLPRRDP